MSAYYLDPAEFSRFLSGLRGEATVRCMRAVYVDGPVMADGPFDLVFDVPDVHDCFGIKRGDKEDRFHAWKLTETRHGRRIDLEWERHPVTVVYEHRGGGA